MQKVRKELGDFLKSLPKIGEDIYQLAKRFEDSFMTFITPGTLFEAFNFEYFGPINGHNLDHLINILNNIKLLNEPVLLHVITKKGKGYAPAEKNPASFHGVASFTSKQVKGQTTKVQSRPIRRFLGRPLPNWQKTTGKSLQSLQPCLKAQGLQSSPIFILIGFSMSESLNNMESPLRQVWPQKDSSR